MSGVDPGLLDREFVRGVRFVATLSHFSFLKYPMKMK